MEGGLGASLGQLTSGEVCEDLGHWDGRVTGGSHVGVEEWAGRKGGFGGLEACWVGSKGDFCVLGVGDPMNSAWRLREQVKGTVRNAPGPETDRRDACGVL